MVTAMGYSMVLWADGVMSTGWFVDLHGRLCCFRSLNSSAYRDLGTDEAGAELLLRACEKIGPKDFFDVKDAKGRRRFDEKVFNSTIFYPPIDKGGFSEKLSSCFIRTAAGNICFVPRYADEMPVELPRDIAEHLAALPEKIGRDYLRRLREANDEFAYTCGCIMDQQDDSE